MSDTGGRQARRERREPAPAAPAGSPVKGIVLIVFAVVIGFVLLQDEGPSTAQTSTGSGQDNGLAIDGDEETTDSTVVTSTTVRSPALVKVIVANGSPVSGAAGRTTEDLKTLGYTTGNPTNAPSAVQTTQILFQVGYEAEAKALATQLGAPETGVAALPTPAPIANLEGSQILVILGPDVAKPA